MEGRGTCFFLRVRCQIRQHIFSSLELRSRVFRVATTFSHVRWRSDSSTPLTTSSTKYFVGLKWPLSVKFAAAAGFCSSIAVAPVSNIASKYPFIHSFPAIFPLAKLGTNEESEAISNSNYQTPLQAATNWICRVFSFFFHTIVIHRVLELKLFFFFLFSVVCVEEMRWDWKEERDTWQSLRLRWRDAVGEGELWEFHHFQGCPFLHANFPFLAFLY